MSLSLVQARNDLLSKLGIEDSTLATALQLQDVVIAVNGAMQTLQTAGEDYFTRDRITISLVAGTSVYPIAQTVQAVIGPVRLNGTMPLRALESRGELDQFDRIFLGSAAFGAAAGTPLAYWVENLRTGSNGDINQVNIWVAPTPVAPAGTLVAEVVNDAPSYVVADLTSTDALPVAQNYTESIFLPIARMLITRSSQFSRPSILPLLTADYQTAMARLGLAGGFPNVDQTPQKPARRVSA